MIDFVLRFFDVLLSGVALLLLSPILLCIAGLLKITGEGDVLYKQVREGKNGKKISIIKFATMLRDSEKLEGGTVTRANDPRVLPIGAILRKYKINELPQLWNIFCGDMSLVGPRPQTARCFDAFPTSAKIAIHKVRPGLTGIGSLIFRDEESLLEGQTDPDAFYDDVIMRYKGELEEWFVGNRSLKIYIYAIVLTVWMVCFKNVAAVFFVFSKLPQPPITLTKVFKN
ncbi:sugar transferase [Pseudomonadales bacterium]|nr:sugar transferase [Pseudomonadales bacterium]